MPVPYFIVETILEGEDNWYDTWGAHTREACEEHIAHLKELNDSMDSEPERWSRDTRKYKDFRIVPTTHPEYVMNSIERVELVGRIGVRPCGDDYADGPYMLFDGMDMVDVLREHMDIPEGDRMDDSGTVPGTYRLVIERVEEDDECGVGFAGLYPVPEED